MNIIRIRNNNLNDNTLLYRGKIQGEQVNRHRGSFFLLVFCPRTGLSLREHGQRCAPTDIPMVEANTNLTKKSNQLLLLICFIMYNAYYYEVFSFLYC